ncbi:MAG: redoxin domain-containing protein [Chitinophagaceae bacterium]
MKLSFIVGVCLGVSLSGLAQQFTLEGQLQRITRQASQVILTYSQGDGRITDTGKVQQNKYRFSGTVQEPVMAQLMVIYQQPDTGRMTLARYRRDIANVFLQGGALQVISVDSFSNIQVKGSAAHQAYLNLNKLLQPNEDRQEELSKAYQQAEEKNNPEQLKKIQEEYEQLDRERKSIYAKFVNDQPTSPVALFAVEQFAGWDIQPDETEALLSKLPQNTRQLPSGQELARKIASARKTSIGAEAIDFVQNDTNGVATRLSSFRGKYVLLDFWASWCGPCRAENPNLVRVYQQYKGKGLHIVGISLDQPNARDRWLQAIHNDRLEWTQLSDLKFWRNEVAVQYGIQAIPQNFLIDPAGKIVAKNLRGENLEATLAKFIH